MFAKKNLVAAAALLAVAGAAQAQSAVKLYGYVEGVVGSFENAHAEGVKDRTTEVASGKMMTSFLGFSGSEDLGGGLKAEFVLETFLALDTGGNVPNNAGSFWGRGSWVGLSGDFGRVALGQYDNPLFISGLTYNPFGSSMGYSPTMRHYYGLQAPSTKTTTSTIASMGFDTGFINSITYESPNMGGFVATAQFSPKESTAAGSKNSWAVAGSYTAGPLSAQLTYVRGGIATAYVADEKVWGVGASYDFGMAKAFFQYTDVDDKTNNQDDSIYQLGVSVPVTDKTAVMASFGQLKREVGATTTKDRVFSLGYEYALSKRTGVYGVFTNNTQTNMESGQTYAVGVKHSF